MGDAILGQTEDLFFYLFAGVLTKMESNLGEVNVNAVLHICLQTHWDREWYVHRRVYQLRLAEVLDAVLDGLDAGWLPCFTLDGQTALLPDYLELRPENETRLRRYIEAGKLTVGPWWVMPDTLLVSGESILRNLEMGIRTAKRFGQQEPFVGYLPDTFGHSADLPGIWQQLGIELAVVWRGVVPPTSAFFWQGHGQATIPTWHLVDGYLQWHAHDPEVDDATCETALKAQLDKIMGAAKGAAKGAALAEQPPLLVPIGGDHLGPPSAERMALMARVFDAYGQPWRWSTLTEWARAFGPWAMKNRAHLPVLQGELREAGPGKPFILPGVASGRPWVKQANRHAERLLTAQLEPLCVMAGGNPPLAELELAWRRLVTNHAHDSIGACSVDEVMLAVESRFAEVTTLAEALSWRALKRLVPELSTTAPEALTLVNTGPVALQGVLPVRTLRHPLQNGVNLPQLNETRQALRADWQSDWRDLPMSDRLTEESSGWAYLKEPLAPLSVSSLPVQSLAAQLPAQPVSLSQHSNNAWQLANHHLTITAEIGADTVQLKTTDGSLVSHRLLWQADKGDSYNAAPTGEPIPGQIQAITPGLPGPLVSSMRLALVFENQQEGHLEIQLQAEEAMARFSLTWQNQLPDHRLMASFNTGSPVSQVQVQGAGGWVLRDYPNPEAPWWRQQAAPQTELATQTGPLHQWLATNQMAWLAPGVGEYEVASTCLNLVLFRAFGWLSLPDTGVRGANAGPQWPTPGGQAIDKALTASYAWHPLAPEFDHTQIAMACERAVHQYQPALYSRLTRPMEATAPLFTWNTTAPLALRAVMPKAEGHYQLHWQNLDLSQAQALSLSFPKPVCVGPGIESTSLPSAAYTTTLPAGAQLTLEVLTS